MIPRDNVIQIQIPPIFQLPAVLAGIGVPFKDVLPSQFNLFFRNPVKKHQYNNPWNTDSKADGANRILTLDLHQGQLQGFFNVPVDELTAVHLLSNYMRRRGTENLVVVTDLGFAKRARTFAELLNAPLAIVEKRREGNNDEAEVLNVIGDVKGKRVVIVDDEIDTAGTLTEIVRAIEKAGAIEVTACATHGVFSGPAIERIENCNVREVIVTDSIPMPVGTKSTKIKRLSSAPLFGEAIRRIHLGESVGALFGKESATAEEMLLWDEHQTGPVSTVPTSEKRTRR